MTVPPGIDPAFWMPDAETIAAFQSADLILLNGAGYAKWTARVSLPRRRPGAKHQFEAREQALRSDLLALDARLREITASDPKRPLLASHPVYQYLARRSGMNLESIMWEPDAVPDTTQWAEFARVLERHPAQWMLWEGMPARETVERLRRLGVESVVFAPAGNRPRAGDFLDVMPDNAANLEPVYR